MRYPLAVPGIKEFAYATVGGVGPTLLWLWFWLRQEDEGHTEPRGLILLCYIMGGLMVMLAIPLQKIVSHFTGMVGLIPIILWASIEELLKYKAVSVLALKSKFADRAIDFPMYMIAGALGFAAAENVLYLLNPLTNGDMTVSLLTTNLRFLGSTLLHAMASSLIGISLGLSYYRGWMSRKIYLFFGIISAIALHSAFNFFIMNKTGVHTWQTLAMLWVFTVITILMFEKLKRIKTPAYTGITINNNA
ncbi:MAG: PrsW family intramembrane metalloprotease [Minisyncoccia bacterium]